MKPLTDNDIAAFGISLVFAGCGIALFVLAKKLQQGVAQSLRSMNTGQSPLKSEDLTRRLQFIEYIESPMLTTILRTIGLIGIFVGAVVFIVFQLQW